MQATLVLSVAVYVAEQSFAGKLLVVAWTVDHVAPVSVEVASLNVVAAVLPMTIEYFADVAS